MSFLIGKTQARSNVSGPTAGTHEDLLKYIMSQGFGGLNPAPGANKAILAPYEAQFQQQNAMAGAAAKESAGNLTGSGFANTLGSALGRNATDQGSFLATMMEQMRQNDANRYQQLVLGTLASPAGGVQYTHTPGLLDYAMQGAQAAAPFLAGPAGIGMNAAQTMAQGGFGVTPPETLPYNTGTSAAGRPVGTQLGQASMYHFGNVPYYQQFMKPEGQAVPGQYGIGNDYGPDRTRLGQPNYPYARGY
jgi:hypothetical protein